MKIESSLDKQLEAIEARERIRQLEKRLRRSRRKFFYAIAAGVIVAAVEGFSVQGFPRLLAWMHYAFAFAVYTDFFFIPKTFEEDLFGPTRMGWRQFLREVNLSESFLVLGIPYVGVTVSLLIATCAKQAQEEEKTAAGSTQTRPAAGGAQLPPFAEFASLPTRTRYHSAAFQAGHVPCMKNSKIRHAHLRNPNPSHG